MLENVTQAVPDNLARAKEQKPLTLWQIVKKMCSQDTRRALSAMLGLLESFGKSLGSVGAAELERAESALAEIGCATALERRSR